MREAQNDRRDQGRAPVLDDVPMVIFTTAYDEYAVRAFEINALDYLVKPVSADRLAAALARAEAAWAAAAKSQRQDAKDSVGLQQLFVRDRNRCWIVRLGDVVLMEAEGNYTRLHFGTHTPLIYRSLSAIEEHLSPTSFFRASRYQIINLQCIESLESGSEGRLLVRLSHGKRAEISRRQARKLRALLSFSVYSSPHRASG
jgi:two-component system, LytTR family, response regulator